MANNAKAAEEAAEGLVAMIKDGATLAVHPSTLTSHQAAGWELAE